MNEFPTGAAKCREYTPLPKLILRLICVATMEVIITTAASIENGGPKEYNIAAFGRELGVSRFLAKAVSAEDYFQYLYHKIIEVR